MKFILSISILFVSFLSSASSDATVLFQSSNSTEIALYPGGKNKKKKRINKKRKRKCAKWGRKGFAG